MVRTLASWSLGGARKLVGRSGVVDSSLPLGLAVNVLSGRALELLRGLVRFQQPAFIGRRVHVRGARRIRFGRWCSVGPYCELDGYGRRGVQLGPGSRLGAHTVVTVTSHLGRMGTGFRLGARSGLGDYCHVGASGGVTIGEDVIAGSYVSFHSQEHIFADPNLPVRSQGVTEAGISVENGCWLGARVTVLDGTTIGENSVVAAGAVVKGHFPPRSLIGGVPGRILRNLGESSQRNTDPSILA